MSISIVCHYSTFLKVSFHDNISNQIGDESKAKKFHKAQIRFFFFCLKRLALQTFEKNLLIAVKGDDKSRAGSKLPITVCDLQELIML